MLVSFFSVMLTKRGTVQGIYTCISFFITTENVVSGIFEFESTGGEIAKDPPITDALNCTVPAVS